MLGYPPPVAVGSGLAFVFGASVIATLKHRDLGQVDYKLGALMIAGTTAGIEVGKELVLHFEAAGSSELISSTVYVVLLGGIGLFVTYNALRGNDGGASTTTRIRTPRSTAATSPTSRRRFSPTASRR